MKTVLVVEDDDAIAELVRGILEDEGYRVLTAADGLEALATLHRTACDLILADLMMPNMNGRDLRHALDSAPALRTIPVVLMTATSAITDSERGQFTAILHKPFEIDDVIALTAALLPDKQATQPAK